MNREWKEAISPKYLHDTMGVYRGLWMPQMDRCWYSNDGYQVTSRLIRTKWGKVEHVAITKKTPEALLATDGEGEIPWAIKQEIKNELFGENRVAIEVFPSTKKLVDVMDVYHLWVLPKDFTMPFGIHPSEHSRCPAVARGCLPIESLVNTDPVVQGVLAEKAMSPKELLSCMKR